MNTELALKQVAAEWNRANDETGLWSDDDTMDESVVNPCEVIDAAL